MIRLLIFLLWVVLAAFAFTVILSLGESVKIEAFGWRLDAPAGVAGATLALFAAVTGLLVSLWKDWTGMRRRAVLRGVLKRRDRGVTALVDAALAHQAADYRKAEKLAAKAAKLLDRDAIASLFRPVPAPAPVEIELEAPPPESLPEPEPEPELLPPPTEETAAPPPEVPSAPTPPDAAPAPPEEAAVEEALDRDVAAARGVS